MSRAFEGEDPEELHFVTGRLQVQAAGASAEASPEDAGIHIRGNQRRLGVVWNFRTEIRQADRKEATFSISPETSDEVVLVGKVAVTLVPPLPDSISRRPPNCRTLSPMP
jgi:hypothetical protein